MVVAIYGHCVSVLVTHLSTGHTPTEKADVVAYLNAESVWLFHHGLIQFVCPTQDKNPSAS